MKLARIAKPSTEVGETKESCVEEARDLEADNKLDEGESLVASFVSDFPKLKMFVFDGELAEPDSVDNVHKHKQQPEYNRKSKENRL